MPIFMDRHEALGLTAAEMSDDHRPCAVGTLRRSDRACGPSRGGFRREGAGPLSGNREIVRAFVLSLVGDATGWTA